MSKKFGRKLETDFVISKFLLLSYEEQEEIFELVNSDDKKICGATGCRLLKLLTDNSIEMAKSADPAYDDWWIMPCDYLKKAYSLWKYFKDNLKKTDKGFIIPVFEY